MAESHRKIGSVSTHPFHDNADRMIAAIDEMLRDKDLCDEDPIPLAVERARALIRKAQQKLGPSLPLATVSAFEGSIRLTWTRPERELRLICPPDAERAPYLYHEEIGRGKSQNFAAIPDVSADALVRWLTWLAGR